MPASRPITTSEIPAAMTIRIVFEMRRPRVWFRKDRFLRAFLRCHVSVLRPQCSITLVSHDGRPRGERIWDCRERLLFAVVSWSVRGRRLESLTCLAVAGCMALGGDPRRAARHSRKRGARNRRWPCLVSRSPVGPRSRSMRAPPRRARSPSDSRFQAAADRRRGHRPLRSGDRRTHRAAGTAPRRRGGPWSAGHSPRDGAPGSSRAAPPITFVVPSGKAGERTPERTPGRAHAAGPALRRRSPPGARRHGRR